MDNSRDRFNNILNYFPVDRPPLFEDGIRDEVLKAWHTQGLGRRVKLDSLFLYDKREEIEPDLDPYPVPKRWPKTMAGFEKVAQHLDPDDPKRFPVDWQLKVKEWKDRDYPLILRVQRGLFLSLGVNGWNRFNDAIQLLVDDPELVRSWMRNYAEFSIQLIRKVMSEVQVDAVLFSEPIGGNHGPLVSPKMYASYVLDSYQPIFELLKQNGISTIIYRTYANTRKLLPVVVKAGFNCLWACESNPQAMDYRDIRREFGKELRLIGGIDSDCLRQRHLDIDREIMELVVPLLNEGGYIPLSDGRVRKDVPYENYRYYRKLLESVTSKSQA